MTWITDSKTGSPGPQLASGGAAHVTQVSADSTGAYAFNPGSLPSVLTYSGPGGACDTITAGPDANGFSFRQTLTYTGANVTGISAWVKQ